MNKTRLIAAVAAGIFVAGSSFATSDNLIQGVAASLAGEAPPLPNAWTPGDLAVQVMDDGTNGDVTSNDNVYTRQLTGLGANAGLTFQWKVASAGWSPVNSPASGGNVYCTIPVGGTINFYIRTTPFGDGFKPDVDAGSASEDGYAWDDQIRSRVDSATTVSLVGDFQSELGGNDWTITENQVVLTDAASGGVGDGLYGASLTGIPAGAYNFKVALNNAWAPAAFGTSGYTDSGGNFNFNVLDSANTITFTLDANTGRVKADNPAATAGPPFYAQSTAWSTGYSAAEDMGTITAGNYYSKAFTVATPGNYSVTVRQGSGRSFPASGGVPFTTTAPSQVVRVIFDRNTYPESNYEPVSDFVCVVDDVARTQIQSYSYVQAVGAFQGDCGGSDWDANAGPGSFQEMKDDGVVGTSGDQFAGDGVYSVKLTAINGGGTKDKKGVGQRTGVAGDVTNPYACQFGGATHGATLNGNNEQASITYLQNDVLYFKIDTLTGRMAVGINGNPARPSRPAEVAPFSSVQDWTSIE